MRDDLGLHPIDSDYELLDLLNHKAKRQKTSHHHHHDDSIDNDGTNGQDHDDDTMNGGHERNSMNEESTEKHMNSAAGTSSVTLNGNSHTNGTTNFSTSNSQASTSPNSVENSLAAQLSMLIQETQSQVQIYGQQQLQIQLLQTKILEQQQQINRLESSISASRDNQQKLFAAVQLQQQQRQQSPPLMRRQSIALDGVNTVLVDNSGQIVATQNPALMNRRVSVSLDGTPTFADNQPQRRLSLVVDNNGNQQLSDNLAALQMYHQQQQQQQQVNQMLQRRASLVVDPNGMQAAILGTNFQDTSNNTPQLVTSRRMSIVETPTFTDANNQPFTFPPQPQQPTGFNPNTRRVSLSLDPNSLYVDSNNQISVAQANVQQQQQQVNQMLQRRASINTIDPNAGRRLSLSLDPNSLYTDSNVSN